MRVSSSPHRPVTRSRVHTRNEQAMKASAVKLKTMKRAAACCGGVGMLRTSGV